QKRFSLRDLQPSPLAYRTLKISCATRRKSPLGSGPVSEKAKSQFRHILSIVQDMWHSRSAGDTPRRQVQNDVRDDDLFLLNAFWSDSFLPLRVECHPIFHGHEVHVSSRIQEEKVSETFSFVNLVEGCGESLD
ncbi:hypothetical protein AVEN_149036-1, partial [Araneus ventricosus]